MTDKIRHILEGDGRKQAPEQRPFPVTRKAIPGGAKINGLSPWEYYHNQATVKHPEGTIVLSRDVLSTPELSRKQEV